MKITMILTLVGAIDLVAGNTYNLPDADAKEYIKGGFAVIASKAVVVTELRVKKVQLSREAIMAAKQASLNKAKTAKGGKGVKDVKTAAVVVEVEDAKTAAVVVEVEDAKTAAVVVEVEVEDLLGGESKL
jgi:hypothetical protein